MNGEELIKKDSFHIKVNLIVQVMNDFSNDVITDNSICVLVNGKRKGIKKGEYYIFTNLLEQNIELSLESIYYHSKQFIVNLDQLDKRYPFLKVRLVPNANFPIAKGTTCIKGEAETNSQIKIICLDVQQPYKLLYEYKKEKEKNHLFLYHSKEIDLDGRYFFIRTKEEEELFYIIKTIDIQRREYQLENELKRNYKKIGTSIYPVYVTNAEKDGTFFLPISESLKGEKKTICIAQGNQIIEKQITLQIGEINEINLR